MKKRILKFEVLPHKNQEIQMPEGSEILYVNTQLTKIEKMFIWALCPITTELENVRIEVVATGSEIEDLHGTITKKTFLGTCIFRHTPDPLVYHLFNITPKK